MSNQYNNISIKDILKLSEEGGYESVFSRDEFGLSGVSAANYNAADAGSFDASLLSGTFTGDTNLSGNILLNEREFIQTNTFLTAAEKKVELDKINTRDNNRRLRKYAKKRRGGVLRYPLEALTEQTDYLQIDIEQYVALGNYVSEPGSSQRYVRNNYFGSDRAGRRSSSRLSKKPLINAGTILLPIPSNVQDSNNVQYDTSTLNGLAATGVKAAEDVMNIQFGQGQNAFEQLSNAVTTAKTSITRGTGNTAAATNAITKFLASKAIGIFGGNVTASQLLARGNGEILNPNMELLFGGPTIRNFRFQFKFTPRNEKESEQVRLIIRAFKRNMAPQAQGGTLDSGNFFLKTPNVFSLRYRTGRKNHPFLNRFKQCFLSDVQTTYTGEGVYSTYDDGTPVSILLDLSFKELQPIYDIDYDSRPGTEAVGY
tara:strand:- start:365 stop:1648 length:1284 start_codon:yes stop_codon:yes gene_type:complete